MFVRPSTRLLIDCVREELRARIEPAIGNDAELKISLRMIDSVLRAVAIRCEHEGKWMREEIAAIEDAAQAIIEAGADLNNLVAGALHTLAGQRAADFSMPALYAEYSAASVVLSCALEAALKHGGPLRARLEALLAARLDREVAIRGEFSLAGRS